MLQNECPGSPAKRPRLHKIRSTVCVVEKCLFKQVKRLTLIIRLVAFLQTKFRQQRGKTETAETFFLAGRSMMWWAVSRAGAIKFTPEKYKNTPRKYSTDLISWKGTSNDRVGTDYIECFILVCNGYTFGKFWKNNFLHFLLIQYADNVLKSTIVIKYAILTKMLS